MPRRHLILIFSSLIFSLIVFSLIKVNPIYSVTDHVVISEVQIGGGTSTDEFVELHNPTEASINLSGWQLAKRTASGTKYNLVTNFSSIEILAGESIIIGHKDSVYVPDIYYSTNYSVAEDNTILLFSDAGKTLVDKVGFGKASDFEGTVLSSAGTETWERKNGIDTDNNLNDFKIQTPTPRDKNLPIIDGDQELAPIIPDGQGDGANNNESGSGNSKRHPTKNQL